MIKVLLFLVVKYILISFSFGAVKHVKLPNSNQNGMPGGYRSNVKNYGYNPDNGLKSSESLSNMPDEQRLIVELLDEYDPAARPVYNASKSVVITFSLSLIQISDMVC